MKNFQVHLTANSVVVTVSADSQEEAVDKAIEMADDKQLADWSAIDVYSWEETE